MTHTAPNIESESLDSRRDAAVEWLLGRINFERNAELPYQERRLKLDRMRRLLTRLGSPDAGMRIVHIAGTKGKGSTAQMTAAMLTAAGYATGVYSSPHLERIEERFAMDGRACSAEELIALVERVRPVVLAMDADPGEAGEGPTFFDITTAMALVYFADRQADAVLLEVGLGGRLDSTNVCTPAVSVVTSISLDHTKQLGDTLELIAAEKAGIIKRGVPVVSGVTQAGPRGVIESIARECGCRLLQLGRDFGYERPSEAGDPPVDFWAGTPKAVSTEWAIGPRGEHQTHNAAVALAVTEELREQGWSIPDEARRAALAGLTIAGRVEVFPGEPTVVIDVAHNEASARALAEALTELGEFNRRTLVLAVSKDKDAQAIARAIAPPFDRVVVTQFLDNPRAVPPRLLAACVRSTLDESSSQEVVEYESPRQAYAAAIDSAGPKDLVCVAGSFFIAAELRPLAANS